MNFNIKLDLRNLTPERIAEARPYMGDCTYSSPCIIGTLLTASQRELFDQFDPVNQTFGDAGDESAPVYNLVNLNKIQFPNEEQTSLASDLQGAFDCYDLEEFDRLCQLIGTLK